MLNKQPIVPAFAIVSISDNRTQDVFKVATQLMLAAC